MSDVGKAVFLSYASQDAEAARRMAEALRTFGVEVWFDQSELRGGDAWDQKLRRQIKECALFVAIISRNSDARLEGYFRREWKLAIDRTHDMAEERVFLLPVVIDDTPDGTTHVPEKFHEVQWTRLPDGETGEVFVELVRSLLQPEASGEEWEAMEHEPEVGKQSSLLPGRRGGAMPTRPAKRAVSPSVLALVALVALALGLTWGLRPRANRVERAAEKTMTASTEEPRPVATVPVSEARKLVEKAWDTMNGVPEPYKTDLEIAGDFCRRAAELDAADPEVWAAWSQVESWYVVRNIDTTLVRKESARAKAARALKLDPQSYEARLAHTCSLLRSVPFNLPTVFTPDVEIQLRQLLVDRPEEPRALRALGLMLAGAKRADESEAAFKRLAEHPSWVAVAYNGIAWAMHDARRREEALAAVQKSVALQPFFGNLYLEIRLGLEWLGDLQLAKSAVEKLPAAELREMDLGAIAGANVYWWRQEPQEMLRLLSTVPRDWLQASVFTGPKDYWVGLAHQKAGNMRAARQAWQAGLAVLDKHQAGETVSNAVRGTRIQLLAMLGRRAEAEADYAALRDTGVDIGWKTAIAVGDTQRALAKMRNRNWAELRYSPDFDPLREDPRFQALLAEAEKDPARAPPTRTEVDKHN